MTEYIIALDAMGGDNAPDAIVRGAIAALRKFADVRILLAGPAQRLKPLVDAAGEARSRLEIIEADEVIGMDEPPMLAVRRKANSSMVKAVMAVREHRAGAVVSAGSTGALLACGMLRLGRIPGVERPALAPVFPGVKGPWLLIDSGANVDCQPKYLAQFGLMGSVYMHGVMGVAEPRVALANIGVEAEKGNKTVREAYEMMTAQRSYRFEGNCEAREIPMGNYDVIVADGFAGNIILKYTEGMAEAMMSMLKESLMSSLTTKVGAALSKPAFRAFKRRLDYNAYGGAPLLGVEGAVVKAHGSSGEEAICNAVRQARTMLEGGVVERIREGLSGLNT